MLPVSPLSKSHDTMLGSDAPTALPSPDEEVGEISPRGFIDYYDLLYVPRDASFEQIQAAYRRFNRLSHPMTATEGLAHLFRAAQEAFDVLSDADSRAAYDQYLSRVNKGSDIIHPVVPLGTFPVVELDSLSWFGRLENKATVSSRVKSVPGGDIEAYGKTVVANAADLLLSIPGVTGFRGVRTPQGVLEHVFIRGNRIVALGSVVTPWSDDCQREATSLDSAMEWLKGNLARLTAPEYFAYLALVPRSDIASEENVVSCFDGRIVPGELKNIIDDAGNILLGSRGTVLESVYRKRLGCLKS